MRGDFLLAGGIGLIVLIGLASMGSSSEDSPGDEPNDTVVDRVKHDNRRDPWMKHVTHWDTESGITVDTDYPPDLASSWSAAYEICVAVKQAYAKGANELPRVTVNGTRVHIAIRVDGSKHRDIDHVQLATSAKHHDFACGITPPKEGRDRARELDVPVYRY